MVEYLGSIIDSKYEEMIGKDWRIIFFLRFLLKFKFRERYMERLKWFLQT